MTIYTQRCRTCGGKYASHSCYSTTQCPDGTPASSQALYRTNVQRVSFRRDGGASSSAVILRADVALADSFFRQPRASDVKDREVTYKRGEFIFKEEYICSRLWMGGFQRGG